MERAEAAALKDELNVDLFHWLQQLVFFLDAREHSYFVTHVRSHRIIVSLPKKTDGHIYLPYQFNLFQFYLPCFAQAKISHSSFHQNAAALAHTFNLTSCQASNIVAVCPDCQRHSFPSVADGINARGLQSLQIWQTDVTHFPEFG